MPYRKTILESGMKFNRLTVIKMDGAQKDGSTLWLCRCECGSQHRATAYHLRKSLVKSCGCLVKDTARKLSLKHGIYKTPTYVSWNRMQQRCDNPKREVYQRYGGRGIKVCERWKKFENFLLDMGERPSKDYSLDRIDNNGHYEPSNCRWATKQEQASNRSTTRFITYKGEKKSVMEWGRVFGIPKATLYNRLNAGDSLDEVFGGTLRELMITFRGKTRSISDWARYRKINRQTVYDRLAKNWPLNEALGYVAHKHGNSGK